MKNWKLYIWRVLEGIGIIAAIVGLVLQYQSLQEQKILGAWQLITTKASGNSGKIQALEFLNSKGVPLVGVDLSNAYLRGVNLKGANLQGVNFTNSNLSGANFEGADLSKANFTKAKLGEGYIENGVLQGLVGDVAHFTDAILWKADFTGADMGGVSFEYVYLRDANFTGVKNLDPAKFNGAFTIDSLYFFGERRRGSTLPTAPEGYEFVLSKTPPKDGKIFIELIKK